MIGTIAFGFFGLAVLISIAFTFSSNRNKVDWRLVASGIGLQLFFAILVILVPGGREFFEVLSRIFVTIIGFAMDGSSFIFGSLADPSNLGFNFAFQVLPTIIFFASLMAVLYHLGLMQKIVQAMAWVMLKIMRISGSESLSVAANVFVGQTEAPLVVRPYISRMTESELFTMMVGGMATIAGGVLAAYITMLGGADEAARIFYAKHLLSASIMAAPATIVIAKLLKPETEESVTRGKVTLHVEKTATNVIEAAANGAADGVKLALNVGGMLLAFVALIALVNYPLGWIGEITGLEAIAGKPVSLSMILGYFLSPLACVMKNGMNRRWPNRLNCEWPDTVRRCWSEHPRW
jgi:CNT family concentrative nucleoside transporter